MSVLSSHRQTVRLAVLVLGLATLLGPAQRGLSARAQDPPPAAPAASPDYLVGPPDVLLITVWKQVDLSGRFEVAEDGTITYPLLGQVQVAGKKVAAIEADITAKLKAGYLKSPQVSVTVNAFRSQQVFVLGEVKTPGPVP